MLTLLIACTAPAPEAEAEQLIDLVNPFYGSGGLGFSYGALGPHASWPNGLVKVGPDTGGDGPVLGANHSGGYYYDDPYIRAFSHYRLPGIGVGDGGGVGLMPASAFSSDPDAWRVPYDHAAEEAAPGWYAITLEDLGRVEQVAGPHSAHERFRWSTEERWLLIDLGHAGSDDVSVADPVITLGEETLSGSILLNGALTGGVPLYFVIDFSQPWSEVKQEGTVTGLRFDGNVEIKLGLSVVDLEGARANVDAELPGWDLDEHRAAATEAWEAVFDTVEVSGGRAEERAIFASALYAARLMPQSYTDVDGRYRGLDGEVHEAVGWTYYSDFSLWDSYRSFHPWVILAWPELAEDLHRSLATMGLQAGALPQWPAGIRDSGSMIGLPAANVLGEGWLKGVRPDEAIQVLPVALAQALDPSAPGAQECLSEELTYGYVPADLCGGSVALTQEHSINNAALAAWAKALGRNQDGGEVEGRALAWRQLYDAGSGFVRPRNSDGTWADFVLDDWDEAYTEGTAWQYLWLAPQDAAGLAEAMGGTEAAAARLDAFFAISQAVEAAEDPDYADLIWDLYYWHGNEPGIHISTLYSDWGMPERGAEVLEWIRADKYGIGPDGLDGNDDGGTMSAWYLLTAAGIYPVNGTADYVRVSPVFDEVVLHRPDGDLVLPPPEGLGARFTHDDLMAD